MSQYYTITEQYHEKKGTYIYVLRLIKKVDKDEFSNLREYAKDYDGYYSTYRGVNGFVFQNEEDAESFGAIIDSYFGTSDIQEVVDETLEDTIEDVVSQKKPRSKRPRIPSSSAVSEKSIDSTPMSSGMPLHIALRNIIQTDGNNIITELRLINILDDFHAFDAIPASKYILRAIIADGYSSKLLSIGDWSNEAQSLSLRFATNTGFVAQYVNILFQSIAYGLGWIVEIGDDNCGLNVELPNANTQPNNKTKKRKIATTHLSFKGVEICGNPMLFANNLELLGFEQDVWCDDFFTMKGSFAGVSNCKIWIHFDAIEDVVYRVKVEFPWYQNRKRVSDDYKKLKKSLQDIYGKPKCEYENLSQDWTSTYHDSLGIIKLQCFPGNCPQVCIDYYDGYYDNHHGEIIEDVAKLDL